MQENTKFPESQGTGDRLHPVGMWLRARAFGALVMNEQPDVEEKCVG